MKLDYTSPRRRTNSFDDDSRTGIASLTDAASSNPRRGSAISHVTFNTRESNVSLRSGRSIRARRRSGLNSRRTSILARGGRRGSFFAAAAAGRKSVLGRLSEKQLEVDEDEDDDDDDDKERSSGDEAEGGGGVKRKTFLYRLFHTRSREATIFQRCITTMIVLDVVSFVLSTEPGLQQFKRIFYLIEAICSKVFLLEYIGKIIVCTERQKYGKMGPVMGRIQYALSSSAIIDLCATAPFFIGRFLFHSSNHLPSMSFLRILSLLRASKTRALTESIRTVYRVIYYNSEILSVAASICVFLVLLTSIFLYYLRPTDSNEEDFRSILSTMYLATLILTGQGGPEAEGVLPWYTKLVLAFTSLFSVAVFAIPSSMFTWGFEAEAERCAKRAYLRSKQKGKQKNNNHPDNDLDTYHSSDNSDSADEEYRKIIAGAWDSEDEESSDDDDTKIENMILETFRRADKDGNGILDFTEFLHFMKLKKAENSQEHNYDEIIDTTSFTAGSTTPMGGMMGGLESRVRQLEVHAAETNKKLDLILQYLQQESIDKTKQS